MNNPLPGLRIGTRLLLIVFVMMLVTLTSSFLIYSRFESALLDEIQDQTESLSKALQISVQQLTSQGMTDDTLLKDYVERLSRRGVKEISILTNTKEVVASSNRARLGRKGRLSKSPAAPGGLVITGTLGDDDEDGAVGKKPYVLDIPIVIDNEKRGYVRLHLLLDDFDALLSEAHTRRLWATILVFAVGMAGLVALSYRLTRSLNEMAVASERVASGDLSVRIETRRRDEVGRLIGTFNQMVERLREQRDLEKRLRRAERTAAIGKLAAGVAHEIRNPLNLISLSVGHLGAEFGPDEKERAEEYGRIVASVRDELNRLNRLVGDFLSYGRPPRLSMRPCRVEEIAEEVLALTAMKSRSQGIETVCRFEEDLPDVQADPEGVRTCLLNVIVNALQAMPTGGTLAVEIASARDERESRVVAVTVRDTGGGIALADIESVFEPYFSARDAGVGLGLAITRRILEAHGGTIRAESTAGVGAAFRLVLPVDGAGAARSSEAA